MIDRLADESETCIFACAPHAKSADARPLARQTRRVGNDLAFFLRARHNLSPERRSSLSVPHTSVPRLAAEAVAVVMQAPPGAFISSIRLAAMADQSDGRSVCEAGTAKLAVPQSL